MHIHLIGATRPNFMKIAPLYRVLKKRPWCRLSFIHTGQHYDENMSAVFLRELGLPDPDTNLGVGSGTHAEQTAGVMTAYEKVCLQNRPDLVIVVGDVNSTMACALVAKKLCLTLGHLEAGLRSHDRTMPEEINRIVTDALADILWTPSVDADRNLLSEGVPPHKIACVGNMMIDSYELLREKIQRLKTAESFGLTPKKYGVVTFHRPTNVDHKQVLSEIVSGLVKISRRVPLIFPVHPRTRERLEEFELLGLLKNTADIILTESQSYMNFLNLVQNSCLVITDSGGIQEETTYLRIPCLTVRKNTERPITLTDGSNLLTKPELLESHVQTIIKGDWKKGNCPPLWDGRTADRVVLSLEQQFKGLLENRSETCERA